MNVTCPQCETTYRVDPAKVPENGVRARCAECGGVIRIGGEAAVEREPTTGAGQGGESGVEERGEERGEEPSVGVAPPPPAPNEHAAREGSTAGLASVSARAASEPVPAVGRSRPPPAFGASDPEAKARRLARALVSDIVVYHPERRERSMAAGSLRQEFREEIQKSWEEYVGQVGDSIARGTPHFRDALNEILAGGRRVF